MIDYVIPKYIEGRGSCSIVKDDNGTSILDMGIRSALKRMFASKMLDINIVRKRCSSEVLQKNLIPLFLTRYEILMPIKVRKPIVSRDGGYGYINALQIKSIEGDKVVLKSGEIINFVESKRAVTKRVKVTMRLADKFEECDDGYINVMSNLDTPATKEDIAVLLSEVARIRKLLSRL